MQNEYADLGQRIAELRASAGERVEAGGAATDGQGQISFAEVYRD